LKKHLKKLKLTIITIIFLIHFNNSYGQKGLIGEYYNGLNFEKKIYIRYDENVNFKFNFKPPVPGLNEEFFSIKWYGKLIAPETGEYLIGVWVDDGIKIWIDNKLIINSWGPNNKVLYEARYFMEKGKMYDLKIDYNNSILEGLIELKWKIPYSDNFSKIQKSNYEIITKDYFGDITLNKSEVKIKQEPKPLKVQIIAPPKQKIKPIEKKITPPKDSIEYYIPKNIVFKQSTSEMIGLSEEEINKLAFFLKRYPLLNVKIEGHTENVGNDSLNLKLSENRAKTVMNYLISKGINKERLKAKGFGGSKPLKNKNTNNSLNRRVEFIIE
jgi:outer membrane protein OmpA-like peptidoglycan-associated protein